jgi:hypothetical protein
MFHQFVFFLFSFLILNHASAEMVCGEDNQSGEFQTCSIQQSQDPAQCETPKDSIIESTGVENKTSSCDNDIVGGLSKKSSKEKDEIKEEYKKQCKAKAKAYKKALMGNLLKKGKVGQLVQVLFKKKKYKAQTDAAFRIDSTIDANNFESMSDQEIEKQLLDELQKEFVKQQKEAGGDGSLNLKELALEASKSPQFTKGFHEIESVPLEVYAKTEGDKFCSIEVENYPDQKEFKAEKCEFCVEKNISSSFTNDCSYMVNSQYSEEKAKKLLGFKNKNDYCNNSMEGEENNLSEVETMIDRICQIAQSGSRPEFTIETSRNLYNDKTPKLAAKRGEFIQKYIREELMNGKDSSGHKRCDLGEEIPDWLQENEFKEAVKVTHPFYEGAKEGDYGPSPYASGEDQKKELDKFKKTLAHEKAQIQNKLTQALAQKTELTDQNKKFKEKRNGPKSLSAEYRTLSTDLEKSKELNPQIFEKRDRIQAILQQVDDLDSKVNQNKQLLSDLSEQIADYQKRLSTIDQENQKKVTLLNEYYAEKNSKGEEGIDRKAWDEKLFNGFKMVRLHGKAVEDHPMGGNPKDLPPAVNIALNAMASVDNFTCVVEPISTHRTSVKGVLKGGLKVITAIASPVVAVTAGAVATAAMPFTWMGSFLCSGCGEPGNVPPALRFANPRYLSFKSGARRQFAREMGDAWDAYINWGGLLKTSRNKTYFENETQDVYEEQQERLNK